MYPNQVHTLKIDLLSHTRTFRNSNLVPKKGLTKSFIVDDSITLANHPQYPRPTRGPESLPVYRRTGATSNDRVLCEASMQGTMLTPPLSRKAALVCNRDDVRRGPPSLRTIRSPSRLLTWGANDLPLKGAVLCAPGS